MVYKSGARERNGCTLCPRKCGADRENGQKGGCHADDKIRVARAALHFWEEPCISGTSGAEEMPPRQGSAAGRAAHAKNAARLSGAEETPPRQGSAAGRAAHAKNAARLSGSGAVFFSGCPLGCVFCQNREISHGGIGTEIPVERLAEIFLELQAQGAVNINLVTASHYVPQVCTALRRAKEEGLSLPIVWNSSGYETVETLRMLEGLVDIYLPDLKYLDPELAKLYSCAEDYPEVAKEAIREMVRQQPWPQFEGDDLEAAESADDGKSAMCLNRAGEGLMRAGVMVRHLLLPGHVREAKRVVSWLHETFGDQIYISLMNQYMPPGQPESPDPVLARPVTRREYERLLDYAVAIGVTQGFYQEGATASACFIPAFDGTGVTKTGL
ncbi:MAG: radical SAM protein [Lachnospiraceae bacterium]|nr:radical SAM protein [Lachnospiraceae bacterium]